MPGKPSSPSSHRGNRSESCRLPVGTAQTLPVSLHLGLLATPRHMGRRCEPRCNPERWRRDEMFGYYKGEPTEYVIRYVRGRLVGEGRGLSFFYYARTTAIASIPMNTQDADFVFNEITANFQAVTVQGQITYRITEPRRLALLLDHLVNPRTKTFRSRDPAK